MRDRFIATLMNLAQVDERIMLLTGDLGFGVLTKFRELLPKQFLNMGVAEQNMIGVATGLALEGRIVFVYSIGNFPTLRCLEHIRNDACYHEANIKIISIGGGLSYGALGFSHHATEDLAIMRALPNMLVAAPCSDWDVEQITHFLVRSPGTAFLRLDRSPAPLSPPENIFDVATPVTWREGRDVTLIAIGGVLSEALKAAEMLHERGISARVLGVSVLKPLEPAMFIKAARETGGIITVEEHTVIGGLGGAIAETLLESGAYPGFFYRTGLRDGFSSIVGSQEYLRSTYKFDAESLAQTAENAVSSKHQRFANFTQA